MKLIILDDFCCCKPRRSHGHFEFAFRPVQPKTNNMPLDITLTNEQQVTVTLKPVTATGKVATLDGVPEWSVVSGQATVIPAANGLSAVVRSSDDPGTSQLLVTADADLGAGVVEISDTIQVTVEGARASALGLTVGTPSPKV